MSLQKMIPQALTLSRIQNLYRAMSILRPAMKRFWSAEWSRTHIRLPVIKNRILLLRKTPWMKARPRRRTALLKGIILKKMNPETNWFMKKALRRI